MSSSPQRVSPSASPAPYDRRAPLLASFDIDGLAAYILEKKPKNVLVMMGAGASVAAGIPDFRSPGVGLYSRLAQRYPELAQRPEALFDLNAFRSNPSLFYQVMNEMGLWPDNYRPTNAHRFVRLLQDKGILLRCYTQNIDTLERSAGIRDELLVEAHGAFASAHCIECGAPVSIEYVEKCAKSEPIVVPRCPLSGDGCDGLVKPDVVFFGESLPQRFFQLAFDDVAKCDLLLIVGTSLKVYPFAMLPSLVEKDVPRVLVNMTRAGDRTFVFQSDVDGTSPIVNDDSSSTSSSLTSSSSSSSSSASSSTPREKSGSANDNHNQPDHTVANKNDEQKADEEVASSSSSEGPNATPLPDTELLHCYRDLLLVGDCQETVEKLLSALGWDLPPLSPPSHSKDAEIEKAAEDFSDI